MLKAIGCSGMPWFRFIVLGAFLGGLGPALVAQQAVPALTGRVVDRADLLSDHAEAALTALLAEHEAETGNQVAVLAVPSLEGEPVESFAVRVATAWGLGTAARDNGVLLLVAVSDRALRIEVGRGLEEALPDVLAGRIIRNEIVPRFREGDYEAGVLAGVDAVLSALDGTYAAADVEDIGGTADDVIVDILAWVIWLALIGVATFFVFVFLLALPGYIRWPLFVLLMPVYWWAGSFMADSKVGWFVGGAVVMWLYVMLFSSASSDPDFGGSLLKSDDGSGRSSSGAGGRSRRRPRRGSRSGGFSGSGGSFGGFSGGGGSFGGGGASGSW